MGNVLGFLCSCKSDVQESAYLGPHGVTVSTLGVSVLAHDIFHYEITSQVPEGLIQHVRSSKKAQQKWYEKLLQAWKEARPPPQTPEEAARLVILALKKHRKECIKGLLIYYGLPLPEDVILPSGIPLTWSDGVKFELETLPVDAKAVTDGDSLTVYVSTADPREADNVPQEIHDVAIQIKMAHAKGDRLQASALDKEIGKAGYRVLNDSNGQRVLARKYRIRLRGIDAPEKMMPYGKEAHQELCKIVKGKCLKIYAYGEDQYGRIVGDIYCNGLFVQELMLKKGLAWHYVAYDNRPQLSQWECDAREDRVGLWASVAPQKPWEWRLQQRNGT